MIIQCQVSSIKFHPTEDGDALSEERNTRDLTIDDPELENRLTAYLRPGDFFAGVSLGYIEDPTSTHTDDMAESIIAKNKLPTK